MIERKEYIQLLEKWKDKKVIKVLTGIRRCGKSSLLRMFCQKVLAEGVVSCRCWFAPGCHRYERG